MLGDSKIDAVASTVSDCVADTLGVVDRLELAVNEASADSVALVVVDALTELDAHGVRLAADVRLAVAESLPERDCEGDDDAGAELLAAAVRLATSDADPEAAAEADGDDERLALCVELGEAAPDAVAATVGEVAADKLAATEGLS